MDYISDAKSKRPGLGKAIEFACEGYTIIVWRLDRFCLNMNDLISVVNQGGRFHSLQENVTIDKFSSSGRLIFHLFAAFGQNIILEGSAAGRAVAKAR